MAVIVSRYVSSASFRPDRVVSILTLTEGELERFSTRHLNNRLFVTRTDVQGVFALLKPLEPTLHRLQRSVSSHWLDHLITSEGRIAHSTDVILVIPLAHAFGVCAVVALEAIARLEHVV